MGIPIPIGSADHALLGSLGVNISAGASQSDIYLTVDRNGRETYSNRDLKIVCTELITTPVLMIQTSCDYFIRTFGMSIRVFVALAVQSAYLENSAAVYSHVLY